MKSIGIFLIRLIICLLGALLGVLFFGLSCNAFIKAQYFAFDVHIMLAVNFIILLIVSYK